MKNRNTAIWVTAASAIVCGCQGIVISLGGLLAAIGAQGDNSIYFFSILLVCLGFAFVLIPIGIGLYTLGPVRFRKRSKVEDIDEPIPPAL